MSGWRDVELQELIEIHDHRRVPLSKRERASRQGPFPYYGAQGVIDHVDEYLFDGRFILVPEDGENLQSRKLPIAFFAEGQFWVNNHAHIITGTEGVAVDRFLVGAIEATDIKPYITGAAQPKLSQRNLRKITLRVPDYSTQLQIAEILDAIDDLIENNRRRVEVLEEMARTIYREWFVHFRYPGHEDVPLVDSDLGPIPSGWQVGVLPDVARLTMGQSPKSEFYNENGVGLPFHQGVTNFGDRYPTHAKWCTVENRVARDGDILLSVRAPVGRINVAPCRLVIGRGLAALRSTTDQQVFLFEFLREVFAIEDSMGGGTIFNAVTKRDLENLAVLIPPGSLVDRFESDVGPIFNLVHDLVSQTRTLTQLRDLLLPWLVTGKIDVSGLELDAVLDREAAPAGAPTIDSTTAGLGA